MEEYSKKIYGILEQLLDVRNELNELPQNRAVACTITKIDEGMMWLKNEVDGALDKNNWRVITHECKCKDSMVRM